MRTIEDLAVIKSATMKSKKAEPIFELRVAVGAYSEPEKMGYTWEPVAFSGRTLSLKISFENPIYISAEEDPELLEIVIRDGSMFLSESGLPL